MLNMLVVYGHQALNNRIPLSNKWWTNYLGYTELTL